MKRILLLSVIVISLLMAGCGQMMQNFARTIDSWVHGNPTAVRYKMEPQAPQVLDADADGISDDMDECPQSAAGVMVDAMGCPISLYVAVRVQYPDKSIQPGIQYAPMIERVGKLLAENPAATLQLEGHTDDSGSLQENQAVSEKRAAGIKAALIEQYDIAPERISIIGYGAARPLVSNATEAGRQRNRRVEMVVNGYYAEKVVYVALGEPEMVNFALGESSLSKEDILRVATLAKTLQENPESKAMIEGHTDNLGDSGKNLILSRERAASVRQMLIEQYGIAEERLQAKGFGDSRPIADNETEQGRFKNRRVTISIQKPERAPRRMAGAATPNV